MRIDHRLAVLTAVLLLPSLASAAEGQWYVAFDAGRSTYASDVLFPADVFQTGPVITQTPFVYDNQDSGRRFTGGYQFNQYFGLELSHVDLGTQTAGFSTITTPFGISCGLVCENSYDVRSSRHAHGWEAAFTASWPFTQSWSLFGRVGLFHAHLDFDTVMTPTQSPPFGDSNIPPDLHFSASDTKDTYGFGVKWAFAEHWAARLGWDDYHDLGNASTATTDARMASLGIEYRF